MSSIPYFKLRYQIILYVFPVVMGGYLIDFLIDITSLDKILLTRKLWPIAGMMGYVKLWHIAINVVKREILW